MEVCIWKLQGNKWAGLQEEGLLLDGDDSQGSQGSDQTISAKVMQMEFCEDEGCLDLMRLKNIWK